MKSGLQTSTIDEQTAARDGGFVRVFVFGEERPFAQCHASTLVELADGRVVVAFFAGTREGHRDVGIWTADAPAGGETKDRARGHDGSLVAFHPPRLAAKIRDVAHWNPVLHSLGGEETGRADEDELVLQFKVGARIRTWSTWITRSRDGGLTFDAPTPLVTGDHGDHGGRGGRGAVRNKPIRLASGDWLAGASHETLTRWSAFFDRSANGIDGWTATERVAVEDARLAGKGLIQPTLWESRPGRVHALFRSAGRRIFRSDSIDDGRTWSRARATALPNNNSALDVARLADGTLALACNPVSGRLAPRTPLSLLFSRDEGESWPWRLDVETGPGEFSYPAIVASGAGLSLCYTWNRRRIAYARIERVAELLR